MQIKIGDLEKLKQMNPKTWQKDFGSSRLSLQSSRLHSYPLVYLAVESNKSEIVRWLVEEKKFDIEKKNLEKSPLKLAIEMKNFPMVTDLIQMGASVGDQITTYRISLLSKTIETRQFEILDLLL